MEEVETTAEDVATARREIAEPAVSAPVTVAAEGGSVVVLPEDLASVLTVVEQDGELVAQLSGQALRDRLGTRLDVVGTPAVDATFDTSSGTPVVVPSRTGTSISAEDLETAVLSVLSDDAPRTANAPLTTSEPRLTTEAAAGLGVKEVIGTYTSKHPCCAPRVTNIQRIADLVDGHVLRPGEQFDLNAFVGPRDKARGFVEAPQILEGQFVDSVGGGVSQFATATFNAVFFSGLKDVTHTPHSYWISRYPPGREATVSFPKPDLVFENDSPTGVLMRTSHTPTSVTVTFWGTKRFDEVRAVEGRRTRPTDFTTEYVDRPDCTSSRGEKGFDIVVTRVFVQGGREVGREDFKTRYKPEPRFVCGPPPRRVAGSLPRPSRLTRPGRRAAPAAAAPAARAAPPRPPPAPAPAPRLGEIPRVSALGKSPRGSARRRPQLLGGGRRTAAGRTPSWHDRPARRAPPHLAAAARAAGRRAQPDASAAVRPRRGGLVLAAGRRALAARAARRRGRALRDDHRPAAGLGRRPARRRRRDADR